MAGFFKKVGTALGDLVGGGAAEEVGYQEGLDKRAQFDYRRSQTDLAMQKAAAERDAAMDREAVRQWGQPGVDIESAPIGNLIAGGMGSDYAGAGLGRQRGQEMRFRETIGDPAAEEASRIAAAQAVSPAQLSDPDSLGGKMSASDLVVINTPDGPRYVGAADAINQAPGARPSAAGGTANQKNYDHLVSLGLEPNLALAIVYRQITDPNKAKLQMVDAMVRSGFYGAEDAQQTAEQIINGIYGPTGPGPIVPPIMPQAGEQPDVGEGATAVNPATGERLMLRAGQWVPVEF